MSKSAPFTSAVRHAAISAKPSGIVRRRPIRAPIIRLTVMTVGSNLMYRVGSSKTAGFAGGGVNVGWMVRRPSVGS
jgi:hypothetical protein